jgi:hypothetical protein
MPWIWESTCSACTFVSDQIGANTPCPAHAGDWSSPTESTLTDEATDIQPTADQPWPFTPHEFARLLLLRGQVRDLPKNASGDTQIRTVEMELRALRLGPTCVPFMKGVHSIYEAWMSDEMRTVLFGGLTLLLFLLVFAFGQLQEIFRATGYH